MNPTRARAKARADGEQLLLRGFTLIELLVVVLIIGVLVTVVVVSLTAARGTGKDAAVKGDLASIQVSASQYYSSRVPGSFGSVSADATSCAVADTVFNDPASPVDATIKAAVAHALKNTKDQRLICRTRCVDSSGTAIGAAANCAGGSNSYLVAGQLDNGKYWCVDSRQAAREIATAPGSGQWLCPAS